MNILERIDASILKFFTKISHRFQILTGRTNFFLARVALVFVAISCAIAIGNYWAPLLGRQTNILFAVINGLFLGWCFFMTGQSEKADIDHLSCARTRPCLSILVDSLGLRMTILGLFIFSTPGLTYAVFSSKGVILFKILDGLYFPGYVSFLYLAIVSPLPSCRGKIMEWVDGFIAGFRKLVPARIKK